MYLHIGDSTTVLAQELVVILNRNTVDSPITENIDEHFRSVAVCKRGNMEIIYRNAVSSQTILKRFNNSNQ